MSPLSTTSRFSTKSPNANGLGLPSNVYELDQTPQLESIITKLRDHKTSKADFVFYADRVIRLVVEEGLNLLPVSQKVVTTPVGEVYEGQGFDGKICGVSILRAGESMENGLRACARAVKLGKILIQRDEETLEAKLFYVKLPSDVARRHCLLLDPMLATGVSCEKAIQVLLDHGVPEERIIFLNLISSPEGLRRVGAYAPKATIVTGKIDAGLNEKGYIIPGLGDFGDRYF